MWHKTWCSVHQITGQLIRSSPYCGLTPVIALSPSDQIQIERWIAAHGTPQQVALRCRIVALCASGESDVAIGKQLSVNRKAVALWRNRFLEQGLDGLWEIAPGRGRKPTFGFDKVSAIVDATLRSKPVGQTHWSGRENGQESKREQVYRPQHLERAQSATPSCQTFQAVVRSQVSAWWDCT